MGKGHWGGRPDLSSHTGDVVDLTIAAMPKRAGFSADKKWLVVESKDFDEEKGEYEYLAHAVYLNTGKCYTASNLDALRESLIEKLNLEQIKLRAIEIFFDELLISFLEERRRD